MEYKKVSVFAEKWGITADAVRQYARRGRIPGAKQIDGYWYIPEDAVKPTKRRQVHKTEYCSSEEMAKEWGLTVGHVCRLCREGYIPDAMFLDGCWNIPLDAKRPPSIGPEGTMPLSKAVKSWGVSYRSLLRQCKAGKIPGAVNIDGYWFVSEKAEHPTEGHLPSAEIAEKWNVTNKHLMLTCRKGLIPGAKLVGRVWYIPENTEKPADGRKNNGRKKKHEI